MSPQNICLIFKYLAKKTALVSLFLCTQYGITQITYKESFPNIGFDFPVEIQSPNDGTNRFFIVEQGGMIKVFTNNEAVTQNEVATFLDITEKVEFSIGQEIGLLGLAFHPNFSINNTFFVYFTDTDDEGSINMVLNKYKVSDNSNSADITTEETIFRFKKNQFNSNHNGGKIAFGPDGYLYISIGDGGGGGDPAQNAQNLNTVFGSMLRIDIDLDDSNPLESNPEEPSGKYEIPSDNPLVGQNGLDELFAWGLRNTWKFSFDVQGRLWAADVGQNDFEEINLITNGGNFGWNRFEGNSETNYGSTSDLATEPDRKPIYFYDHSAGDVSVTGGYFYNGTLSNPLISNKYIFGDYVSGRVWALDYDELTGDVGVELLFRTNGQFISSFGQDNQGNLYFLNYGFGAKIYSIIDLNDNGSGGTDGQVLPGAWSSFQDGVNGTVETIAMDSQGNYYIGGLFTEAGSISANNIAKYSTDSGWEALGSGTNGKVNAIAINGNDEVFVGGDFTIVNGINANYIAKWANEGWSILGSGTSGEVLTIAINDTNEVFLGGTFVNAGGITVNNVSKFTVNQWSALSDSNTGISGTNNEVRTIAFDTDGSLLIGGNFDSAGGNLAPRIARWNESQWGTVGDGTSGFVQAIFATEDHIYAGGNFAIAGNTQVNRIAKWNKSNATWEPLEEGVSGNVNSIIPHKNGILVGGNFLTASGNTMNNAAYWEEGLGWFALGGDGPTGMDNEVRSMLKMENQNLLVGGSFTSAGEVVADRLASFTFENTLPLIECPENISLETNTENCGAVAVLDGPVISGNGSERVSVTASRSDGADLGDPFLNGQTLVTWTVTFENEPIQSCNQLIEVFDTVLPIASCKDITISLDENGQATVIPLDLDDGSSDNCEIETIEINPSNFTVENLGSNEVQFTVTDTSGNTSNCLATVTVTEIPEGCLPLELPWQGQDIGGVATAGSSCFDQRESTFQIGASGADIWGASDEFHFVYQPLDGDGEIIARVLSLENTDPWAKAGVMMRNSLDPSSEFVLMSMSPNPSLQGVAYTLQDRPAFGASSTSRDNNIGPILVGTYSYYMRLVREGNTFSGYASDDNENWELLGSRTIDMNENILVGLAVTSHNDGELTQAVFDEVGVFSEPLDTSPPILSCAEGVEGVVEADSCVGILEVAAPNASDNISASENIQIVGVRSDGLELSAPFPLGQTSISWTAIDEAGNSSAPCEQVVSVIDNQPPIAQCSDAVVELPPLGSATITADLVDNGSLDSCGAVGLELTPNTFTQLDLGEKTVTLTVTDESGNSASCTAIVTVVEPSIIDCPDQIVNEDDSIVLPEGSPFLGIDEVFGTNEITNDSPCALALRNNDAGEPFANYRIPIDLAGNGILAGDELLISLDGNSTEGVAYFEVLQNNTPNTALVFHTYVGGWSTYATTILVPENITSLDIWLYSNHLNFDDGGTAYYDNLIITNLSAKVPNSPPTADAGIDVTLVDADDNGFEQVTLDGTSSFDVDGDIVLYVWSVGGEAIATGPSPTVTLPLGSTEVQLSVTDDDGDTGSDALLITVEPPPNIAPTADAGTDQTITDFDGDGVEAVTLDGTSSFDPDGILVSYEWSDTNGVLASGQNPTILVPIGVTELTLVIIDDNGAIASDTMTITVLEPPKPCANYLPNEDESIFLSEGLVYLGIDEVLGTSAVTNESPCALSLVNNDVGQPFGSYRITMDLVENGIVPGDRLFISLDGNGSAGIARVEVLLDGIPNNAAFSHTYEDGWSTINTTIVVPENIGRYEIWLYTNYLSNEPGTAYYDNLVVRKLESVEPLAVPFRVNTLNLYPNPVNETVTLYFDEPTEVLEFQVFDLLGRLVRRLKVDGSNEAYQLSVQDLPTGTYFIKTMDVDGRLYDEQMVIER